MKPSNELKKLFLKLLHLWPLEMAEVRDPGSGWKEWREGDGQLVDFIKNDFMLINGLYNCVFWWSGLPGGEAGDNRPTPTSQQLLPQIQKNEKPSVVILKYVDGITKRIGKIVESWVFHLHDHHVLKNGQGLLSKKCMFIKT